MPKLTPINQISELNNGDQWNPITESQNQGDSIEAAMMSMPTFVADANDRDARFGTTPVVGSACFRADMGWVEYYYDVRPAGLPGYTSVDPGRPAGWYPVFGRMPSIDVTQNQLSVGNSATQTLSGFDASSRTAFVSGYAGSGLWNLNMPGRWHVSVTVQVPTTTATSRKEVVLAGTGQTIARQSIDSTASGYINVSGEAAVTTGGQIWIGVYQNSGSTQNVNVTVFRAVYMGPL